MPTYQYRCRACHYEFQETHSIHAALPECPDCEAEDVQRVITGAPTVAGGMLTHAGDGKRATKEELERKWAEETPKLRRKLRDTLGEDAVNNMASLNHDFDQQ